MSLIKKIQSVDQESTDLVFGYTRNIQASIKSYNIPLAIYHLCLAYYYYPEYFDRAKHDYFQISEDKETITCIKDSSWVHNPHTIYMKKWILSQSNKIIKWTFKINNNE